MKKLFICMLLVSGLLIACNSTPKAVTETVDSVAVVVDSIPVVDSISYSNIVTDSLQ